MNARATLVAGALAGFLTVLLGAAGAHALGGHPAAVTALWQKAVHYQGLHALALLVTGLLLKSRDRGALRWAALFFLLGIGLFSGSLYLLALTGEPPLRWITPFGGSAFLLGWLLLAISAWREKPA